MKQAGCTTCHGGEGHRVNDFTSVAHWPEDEEQKKSGLKNTTGMSHTVFLLQCLSFLKQNQAV